MTFGEHLEELRRRLMIGLIAFAAAFAAAFAFQGELMAFYTRPYEQARKSLNVEFAQKWAARPPVQDPQARFVDGLAALLESKGLLSSVDLEGLREVQRKEQRGKPPELGHLQAISSLETFSSYMLECLITALIVAAPVLLYEMWRFVAAGLYQHERKMTLRILPVSLLLFFVGVAFGYGVLAELSVRFLVGYGDLEYVVPQVSISSYLGLLFLLLLVMGLVFQIPLIMTVLAATGLVSPDFYRGKRRLFILGIFVVEAIITPPDYVSQLLVAGPMLALFEIGLVLARSAARLRAQRQGQPA